MAITLPVVANSITNIRLTHVTFAATTKISNQWKNENLRTKKVLAAYVKLYSWENIKANDFQIVGTNIRHTHTQIHTYREIHMHRYTWILVKANLHFIFCLNGEKKKHTNRSKKTITTMNGQYQIKT